MVIDLIQKEMVPKEATLLMEKDLMIIPEVPSYKLGLERVQSENGYSRAGTDCRTDAANHGGTPQDSKPLGLKWAHPISVPETGCVLVATEKLDGPANNELATTFADCSLHFGGPLEASMFLLKTGEKAKLPTFEEVIPGLCFGARNSLDEAAALVKKGVLKPQDFRFFVGYAGWQLDQLREEIESDYWYVASCSSNLICGTSSDSSSENLWEEILQLMGGHYSELSRKPKQDM
ncbi:hypothetical protein GH714_012034 [Hevea brasiliensis]|uniref:Uncharacterized protein n=1 Tax=Hevea brasiliensis TaxID=3981 RepID=A0A6A6KQ68_HEVBR|nr:hypothetical protein GH714_012034 [Hevea brasiliensis]